MKPLISFLVFSLLSLTGICQDTLSTYFDANWKETTPDKYVYKRKKVKNGNQWDVVDCFRSGAVQMKGSYLDDSCKSKQGEFVFYNEKGSVTQRSNYKAGEYDGKSTWYNENGKVAQEGFYKMGKYDGDWTGYYLSGKMSGKARYKNDKQLNGEYYNEDGSVNNDIHEFIKESEYPGGGKALSQYLSSSMRYPDKAVKNKIEGTVIVQFVVDQKGKVTDVEVIKSVDKLLDDEAVRVIRKMPAWAPAIWGGKFVKSYKRQPIQFKFP